MRVGQSRAGRAPGQRRVHAQLLSKVQVRRESDPHGDQADRRGEQCTAGFVATGEPGTLEFEALEQRDGTVTVDLRPDGPLRLTGNMEIIAASGRTVDKKTDAFLCRCGASANKPYCDGSHTKIGFKA